MCLAVIDPVWPYFALCLAVKLVDHLATLAVTVYQGCHLAVFAAKFGQFGRILRLLAAKNFVWPQSKFWPQFWPYLLCLAAKMIDWPQGAFWLYFWPNLAANNSLVLILKQ